MRYRDIMRYRLLHSPLHTHAFAHGHAETKTYSSACTCTHTHDITIHSLARHWPSPMCLTPTLTPRNPGSLPTCFGYLVHRHTQLLRHVAQHGEDGETSQDAGDGIAQSDDEGVSAKTVPAQTRVSRPRPQPTRPPWRATLLLLWSQAVVNCSH